MSIRLISRIVLVCAFAFGTSGCQEKPAENVPATSLPQAEAPAPEPEAISLDSSVPVSIPTGTGTALSPNPKGEAAPEAAKAQDRFNRNNVWLARLAKNDRLVRSQVRAEIQKAGLSPAELAELRKLAEMYRISL